MRTALTENGHEGPLASYSQLEHKNKQIEQKQTAQPNISVVPSDPVCCSTSADAHKSNLKFTKVWESISFGSGCALAVLVWCHSIWIAMNTLQFQSHSSETALSCVGEQTVHPLRSGLLDSLHPLPNTSIQHSSQIVTTFKYTFESWTEEWGVKLNSVEALSLHCTDVLLAPYTYTTPGKWNLSTADSPFNHIPQ